MLLWGRVPIMFPGVISGCFLKLQRETVIRAIIAGVFDFVLTG